MLHRFRDVTTTLYVTACNLEKLSFNKMVEITGVCAIQFVCKHIMVHTCYICQDIGVRKVSDRKSDFQGHCYLVPFDRQR